MIVEEGVIDALMEIIVEVRRFCPSISPDPNAKRLSAVLLKFDQAVAWCELFDYMRNYR